MGQTFTHLACSGGESARLQQPRVLLRALGPSIRMEKGPQCTKTPERDGNKATESRDISRVSSSCQYLLHKYW